MCLPRWALTSLMNAPNWFCAAVVLPRLKESRAAYPIGPAS
jgi:hypothetical protein